MYICRTFEKISEHGGFFGGVGGGRGNILSSTKSGKSKILQYYIFKKTLKSLSKVKIKNQINKCKKKDKLS